MFLFPDWPDDDDTTLIEKLTSRYTSEQCKMADMRTIRSSNTR